MTKQNMYLAARQLVFPEKGILASDESTPSITKKFEKLGIKSTAETRRRYREIFITAPEVEKYISGIILYDETIRQSDSKGKPFTEILSEKGILIGIKVDGGTEPLRENSEELISIGLGGLDDRLKEYYEMGARFTKWRSVVKIDEEKEYPTKECLEKNAEILARYASIAQNNGFVPIVEPEVLMTGTHTIETAEKVVSDTLSTVFEFLEKENVDLKAMILKSSMVLQGSESGQTIKPKEIAQKTVDVLKFAVPHEVAGIVFLSGGQTPAEAAANLDAIARKEPLPWEVAFSFLRALEQPSLEAWKGKDENIKKAQELFIERLQMAVLADQGMYSAF